MLNFLGGFFLVACRSEWSILKPLKGGNARQFFWLLAGRNSLIFTLKRRGNARHFFLGRSFGRLPIGMVHFKTLEGGKLSSIFCWLLAGRNSPIFNPKNKGKCCHFFFWVLCCPFRFQNAPFRRQTRLNLAPERCILGLLSLSAVALWFSSHLARM